MGRPPTSGYCQTCRKRRVKCDKARPHCTRCLNAGYPCGGYDVPLRMQVLGIHSDNDGTQRLVRMPTSLAPVPPPTVELRLSHSREDTSWAYFFSTFNWAPFWRPLLLSATTGDFPDINKVCFQAITYGYMGRSLRDGALEAKGTRLYGRVLSEVRSLLMEQAKPQLAKLVLTMIVMGMYEFVMNKKMGRAPPHHLGIIQILQHCGPETFQEPNLLQGYRSCRAMLICMSLCRQSRCFLEDQPWKTVPWQHTSKTLEDRLMDIMVHLPGLAEAVAIPHNRAACIEQIKSLTTALQDWRWAWHAANSTSVRLVRHKTITAHSQSQTPRNILLTQMHQTTLEFSTPRQALDILYYNAALIYLMQLQSAATSPHPLQPSSPPPQPERLTPADWRFIYRQALSSLSPNGHPLLLPGQARFPCQAAAEAFMTLSCATRLLAATETAATVVTPAAMGIVYWVLKSLSGMGMGFGEEEVKGLMGRVAVFTASDSNTGGGRDGGNEAEGEVERVFAGHFVGAGNGGGEVYGW